MRLLVVEDSAPLLRSLVKGLSEEGFAVDSATDGEEGLHLACEIDYDAIVLDRMLPKLDGVALLRQLRARGRTVPVLMLTALGELLDRVSGLDSGADDYVVKPFAFAELLARLRALLRRGHGRASNEIAIGSLRLDLAARRATVAGRPLALTAKEYSLLELLTLSPGKLFTRTDVEARLYDEQSDRESNVIDVFVGRLRRKLDGVGLDGNAVIRTRRGAGYLLDVQALESQ